MNSLGRDGRTLILRGLDSPFKNVCIWACRKVAVNHITVGVPGLIRLLNSIDPEVAVQAAVALEEISQHYSPAGGALLTEKGSGFVEAKAKPQYEARAESLMYSSKPAKVSAPRSVFPLPGEANRGVVTASFGNHAQIALQLTLL